MPSDTVRVKPWPGLILDGIPPKGAEIPRALAEEWIGNHLVIAVPVAEPPKPVIRQVKATRPQRRRNRK